MSDILVIGYGNSLRGDDGVGPRVAERIAAGNHEGVRAVAVHQLLPEMAEWVADARLAIFVDASVESFGVRMRRLTPTSESPSLGHAAGPRWLLSLARLLTGDCPPVWLITVPATRLDFGEELSPRARAGIEEAVRQVEMLIGDRLRAGGDGGSYNR